MRPLRPKESDHAPQTSTQRKSWCYPRTRCEDSGRGQSRHTRRRARCEDRRRRRRRQTRTSSPHLTGGSQKRYEALAAAVESGRVMAEMGF